jgi:hypothetical protein
MNRPLGVPAVLLLLGLAAAHAEARAQSLSLIPEIGLYIPTEQLVDASDGTVGELEAGPSFGLRLALLLGDRISLSVGGSYVPTTFALRPEGGPTESQDARLFNGTGQLVVFVLPPGSPVSVFVNAGLGVVSRGGVAFTDEAETSDIAGVLGGGASLRLGGLALTAGADVFTYTAEYTGATQTASEIRQLDVQLRLGLGVPFGGGADREEGPDQLPHALAARENGSRMGEEAGHVSGAVAVSGTGASRADPYTGAPAVGRPPDGDSSMR